MPAPTPILQSQHTRSRQRVIQVPAVLMAGQNGSAAPREYTRETDVFAFGLIILELATKRKLEAGHCDQWPQLLDALQDPHCKALIHR